MGSHEKLSTEIKDVTTGISVYMPKQYTPLSKNGGLTYSSVQKMTLLPPQLLLSLLLNISLVNLRYL